MEKNTNYTIQTQFLSLSHVLRANVEFFTICTFKK